MGDMAASDSDEDNGQWVSRRPCGSQPFAYMDRGLAVKVGAMRSDGIIWITPATRRKQLRVHPNLAEDDYRAVAAAFGDCEVVKEGRNGYTRHLLFLVKRGEIFNWRWWKAAVKATIDGNELYLVTLHQLETREIEVIRAAGIVVRTAKGSQRLR